MKTMKGNKNMNTRKSTAYWMNFNPADTEFFGQVRRNKIQRRPMAVMPYRMTDGKNHPVTVSQIIGPKLENGKFSNKFS